MRVNQYLARASGISRRAADTAIAAGRVSLNGRTAVLGDQVAAVDEVRLDGSVLHLTDQLAIIFHKPVGYVTSRRQQGRTPTIYALLPQALHQLKPVGRLDRDSSGLLILTNDGTLAQRLQHPSSGKLKCYEVQLNHPLTAADAERLRRGIELADGLSAMEVRLHAGSVTVALQEGRNRQIRRSFAALGYAVVRLHRTSLGPYQLGRLQPGRWQELASE